MTVTSLEMDDASGHARPVTVTTPAAVRGAFGLRKEGAERVYGSCSSVDDRFHVDGPVIEGRQYAVAGVAVGRGRQCALSQIAAALEERGDVRALYDRDEMFALAVYDRRRCRLHLIRDAVGHRTIYYAAKSGAVWFSTRSSGLTNTPPVSREVNVGALRDYLIYAYVPGGRTLIHGLEEVRPGQVRVWGPNGHASRVDDYFVLTEDVDEDGASRLDATGLRTLIDAAIQSRLPSHGPVGIYLSGGVDSTLVAALAACHHQAPVHTFSVNFGDNVPTEAPFAALAARVAGTHHHEIRLSPQDLQAGLFETVAALDDPIGDPLTVPNLLLGQRAKEEVDVILNGEGGDPVFGGPKNQPMLLEAIYRQRPSLEDAYLRSYQKCYDDLPLLLTDAAKGALTQEPDPTDVLRPLLSESKMRSLLNRLMHINIRFKGADHILTKVSNLTTHAGLIGQSPLFDRRIVQESFRVHPTRKVQGAVEKAILKEAVRDVVPTVILHRPKAGMRVPVQSWMRTTLRRYAARLLLDRRARIRPYVHQDLIRTWTTYRGDPYARYGRKLWMLLSLEVFLRTRDLQ